ncbi:MAG: flagellar hook-basal body complex protein FliE [Ignavibacteria bacterium]|jgi:flagellar hook-basal body complex protein FliE|nr:flagellar hook-basal body complex protein FliE [Ignavibacteria bacterium]
MLNSINSADRFQPLVQQKFPTTEKSSSTGTSFADTMKGFLGDVNTMQEESKGMTEKFIKGEDVDLHDVMIASEKAKTSFQLLMELRSKGLDLYREVLRMQV